MAIKSIILEDGTVKTFEFTPPPKFNKYSEAEKKWNRNRFLMKWEKEVIFKNILTDIEDYAKDEFDLVENDEYDFKIPLEDCSDEAFREEAKDRGLLLLDKIENLNINNESFIPRFVEIINRGDDFEINQILENLEKKYKIK